MPNHVVIIDEDRDVVGMLSQPLEQLGITVHPVTGDARESHWSFLTARFDRHHPDLIVVDVDNPVNESFRVCEELCLNVTTSRIPVIVVTGHSDQSVAERCDDLGFHHLAKSNGLWNEIKPLIGELLDVDLNATNSGETTASHGEERRMKPKVLCIDDDHLWTMVLENRLNFYSVDVIRAFSGEEGLWKATHDRPDVIITDYAMPEGNAEYLLEHLRADPRTHEIPVIVLTGCDITKKPAPFARGTLQSRFFGLGADVVLTKPVSSKRLLQELGRFIPIAGLTEAAEEPSIQLQNCGPAEIGNI